MKRTSINWPQLATEFVIVVGGILMALGIDSWWAERGAAELERAFLGQLVVDLRQAENQLSAEVVGAERAGHAAVELLAVARGDRVAEPDSIAAWVTVAGWWGDPIGPLSTAQALASSENLFVVQNPAIRSGILQLLDRVRNIETRIQAMEERVFDNYTIVNRRIDPIARGQAMYVGVSDGGIEAFAQEQEEQRETTLSWSPLFTDPEFRANFTDLFWAHENLRWLQQTMLDATRALREDLQAEIERRAT